MKMLTKAIEARFRKLGVQDKKGDKAIVVVKYFDPTGSWTWYATEYDPEEKMFFGLVDGFEQELGYFSLADMEGTRGKMGLYLERDLHWDEKAIDEVRS